MTDERADRDALTEVDPDEQHPAGAFVLTMAFLVLIVVLWVYSYSILVGRG